MVNSCNGNELMRPHFPRWSQPANCSLLLQSTGNQCPLKFPFSHNQEKDSLSPTVVRQYCCEHNTELGQQQGIYYTTVASLLTPARANLCHCSGGQQGTSISFLTICRTDNPGLCDTEHLKLQWCGIQEGAKWVLSCRRKSEHQTGVFSSLVQITSVFYNNDSKSQP